MQYFNTIQKGRENQREKEIRWKLEEEWRVEEERKKREEDRNALLSEETKYNYPTKLTIQNRLYRNNDRYLTIYDLPKIGCHDLKEMIQFDIKIKEPFLSEKFVKNHIKDICNRIMKIYDC